MMRCAEKGDISLLLTIVLTNHRKSNERRVTRRSQKSTEEREGQACFENISTKCPKTDGAQQRAGKISEG